MTDLSSIQPVVQAKGLIKTFGRVVGLNSADMELYPGEVLAVIGDNGAGKSTLIKCISGAEVPDGGEILLDGTAVQALTNEEIATRASLKVTSLYELASRAGLANGEAFVQHFIDYERSTAR